MSSQGIPLKVIQPTADTTHKAEALQSQIHIVRSTANIFTIYRTANTSQLCLLFLSGCCAIVAGAAMPLVTVVYGNFAREFITGDNNAPDEIRDRVQSLALYLVYIGRQIWIIRYPSFSDAAAQQSGLWSRLPSAHLASTPSESKSRASFSRNTSLQPCGRIWLISM